MRDSEELKGRLIEELKGNLIRFYYGTDMIGNEIGAAAKKCDWDCRRYVGWL